MITLDDNALVDRIVRVVGTGDDALEWVRARSAALGEVRHPAVVVPDAVGRTSTGQVVAAMPRVLGESLATVLALRGGLRAGECVTVGVAVADALAAMHRHGLAHGDVAPANIVVAPERIWLVDTVAGASHLEAGTPPFAAPERVDGARAPGDVYALGRVLQEAVTASESHLVEPWIAPMIHPDAAVRPSAAMVARALTSCAPAEPIDVPVTGVVDGLRARAAPHAARTIKRDPPRGWAVRKALVRAFAGRRAVAWAVAVVVSGATVALSAGLHGGGAVPGGVRTDGVAGAGITLGVPWGQDAGPASAAVALMATRVGAIAHADAGALRDVYVPASAAALQAEGLASLLEDGQVTVRGLTLSDAHGTVVAASGGWAVVEVEYGLGPHTVMSAGTLTHFDAVREAVVLRMRATDQGWRIVAVSARSPLPRS